MEKKYQLVTIENLKPYANNARTHSKAQIDKIAKSIKEFGFVNPVLIDADFGIIAGHGRIEGAKKLKMKEVPCVLVDHLSEAQKKAYILADNRLALDAGWNEDILKMEFEEHTRQKGYIDGEDEAPELPEKPKSRLGDIYLLGDHRVLCGDSTDAAQVALLKRWEDFTGQKAILLRS